jgi:tRNA pseudouridine38-40 synthase
MQECASLLVGSHDFASFTTERQETQDTVRTVLRSEWTKPCEEPDELHYHIAGNGFLYNMVRALVGTMLLAGRGKLAPDGFAEILDAHDRSAAGPTAPAQGLTLLEVRFGDHPDLFGPQPEL